MPKIKRTNIYFYKQHNSLRDTACFYCGGYGESKDHVPPITYPDFEKEHDRILVRSCLLCNSLLGHRAYFTLLSRCEYLLFKYRKRFKKTLSMPLWSEWEIDELEGQLKRKIIMAMKKKKYIESKILYIENNVLTLKGVE